MFSKIVVIVVIILSSCTSGGGDDGPDKPIDPKVILPTNIFLEVDIIGVDTNNPNGDGSGLVKFTVSAKDAISYAFRPGTGAEVINETGKFEHTYTESGLNNHKVTVLAYSKTGHSIRTSKDISIKGPTNSNLIWSDEFDTSGSPDSNNWNFNIGNGCPNICGWGNNEKEYYTDRLENVKIEGGILKIIAKKESHKGFEYTSARMKTENLFDFKYGRVEVRAKLPEGGGTWPAIWMLGSNIRSVGWPACGEIDIMEHVGNNQGTVSSAMHTPSSNGNTVNKGERFIADVSSEFHIYTVNWTAEKIEFFIDNVLHYTYNPSVKNSSTWPFDAKQFIILNVAMGGSFGGSIDANFTKSTMEIDYVRVYQ